MSLIEWREEFSTGISGIDFEHQELIASVNSFYESLDSQSDKDALINALNDIYGEIYSHFVLEERLMEKNGYDQYVEHKNDHARLLDEIREITEDLEKNSEYSEEQLKQKMNDWFSVHFKTHDARLHKLEELIASNKKRGNVFTSLFKKNKDKASGGK